MCPRQYNLLMAASQGEGCSIEASMTKSTGQPSVTHSDNRQEILWGRREEGEG